MLDTKVDTMNAIATFANKTNRNQGAKYIPKKVTRARSKGIVVKFIVEKERKFWLFPDGKRLYHT